MLECSLPSSSLPISLAFLILSLSLCLIVCSRVCYFLPWPCWNLQVTEWISDRAMEYLQQNASVGESQVDAQDKLTAFHEFKKESQVSTWQEQCDRASKLHGRSVFFHGLYNIHVSLLRARKLRVHGHILWRKVGDLWPENHLVANLHLKIVVLVHLCDWIKVLCNQTSAVPWNELTQWRGAWLKFDQPWPLWDQNWQWSTVHVPMLCCVWHYATHAGQAGPSKSNVSRLQNRTHLHACCHQIKWLSSYQSNSDLE